MSVVPPKSKGDGEGESTDDDAAASAGAVENSTPTIANPQTNNPTIAGRNPGHRRPGLASLPMPRFIRLQYNIRREKT
jgi:hypothetical protein